MCHSDSDHAHDILVVDDNPRSRQYISTLLAAVGHRVTVASDGSQALSLLLRKKFQLLITDLEMGPLDGFDLIALMSRLPPQQRIPKFIVCSTHIGNREIEARPELRRAFRLIAKPIHPRDLLTAVAAALPRPHADTAHGFSLLGGLSRLVQGLSFSPR